MNMINWFNIGIVVLMILPNIIYAVKIHDFENLCSNRAMTTAENISRIACIALMIYPLGQGEFGFPSAENFIIYSFGNVFLMAVYIAVWFSFFKKNSRVKGLVLAVVPPAIFVLCGLTLEHWLLSFAGVLFGISHIYVTSVNSIKKHGMEKQTQKPEDEKTAEQKEENKK